MSLTCLSQTALDYVDGRSDKLYIVQVQEDDSGAGVEYVAVGYYGRRGSTLSTAQKYRGPSRASADAAADRMVREKTGKGYSSMAVAAGAKITGMPASAPTFGGASVGSPSSAAPVTKPVVGIVPMRAEVLAEADLEAYLTDPNWVVQRKYDGERSPVSMRRSGLTATNLKGTLRTLAASSEAELKTLLALPDFGDERETTVDGEELPGGIYVIYDVVTMRDNDVRKLAFDERFAMLEELLAGNLGLLAPTAWTEAEKRAMLDQARAENWEGLMFRSASGTYVNGRTSFILKFKLWDSCTCRVLTVNAKRSIQVAVRDADNNEVFIGNVTVPVNQDIPEPDDLVEVRYLYAMAGGCLYQPTLLGIRTDKDEADLRSSLRPAPPEKGGAVAGTPEVAEAA